MDQFENSPLTGAKCRIQRTGDSPQITFYADPEIGTYGLTRLVERRLGEPSDRRELASAIATKMLREGLDNLIVCREEETLSPKITTPSFRINELLNLFPRNPEKLLDDAFINACHNIKHPSQSFLVDERMRWIFYSDSDDSAQQVLEYFLESGFIKNRGFRIGSQKVMFGLTPTGWQKLFDLRRTRPTSKTGFVAMWFDPEMNSVYDDGIAPALTECGLDPIRIDTVEHNNKICDEIIAAIRRSRVVVADFTGHRGGVYYEAGFAQGLGIPVIWTCRNDHFKDLHFDTRQYNHIGYDNAVDLRASLINRIRAIFGDL